MLQRDGMKVVGVDISVKKLQLARKYDSDDVSFVAADANALPFRDDCFNGVVFQSVLTYTNIQASLLEARRILVPNGVLVMCEFNSMNPWVKLKRGWGSREIFTPAQYRTILLGARFLVVVLKTIDLLPTRLRMALPDQGTVLSFFKIADMRLSQIPGLGNLGGFVLVRAQKPDKPQVSSMRS
jgi:SAM-dependent methyltransferase